MAGTDENERRRALTLAGHAGLEREIGRWAARWGEEDPDGRHGSQREALEGLFEGALTRLGQEAAAIPGELSSGLFYERCREVDKGVVWLRRIWDYYAARVDQRRDPRLARALRAADEIVWSCYQPAFGGGAPRRPYPLSFVHAEHLPMALESDRALPDGLSIRANLPSLQAFLRNPPVPLLGLPPACLTHPWWLVVIAHEVGHHVAHDLGLLVPIREVVSKAAGLAHADPVAAREAEKRWGAWSDEVFADFFSLIVLGRSALVALAETVWGGARSMTRREARYPSPAARVAAACAFAELLWPGASEGAAGRDWASVEPCDLVGLDAAVAEVEVDLLSAVPVAKAALAAPETAALVKAYLPGNAADNAMFWGPAGAVGEWAEKLRGADNVMPREVRTGRLLVCGAFSACRAIEGAAEPVEQHATRGEALAALAAALFEEAPNHAPPGTRAASSAPSAADLGEWLLADVRASGGDLAEVAGRGSTTPLPAAPTDPGDEVTS